jgi:hypothetical protein
MILKLTSYYSHVYFEEAELNIFVFLIYQYVYKH